MDLFRLEDVERNSQVIVAGYGKQYEDDDRGIKKTLKFSRMNMFLREGYDLNITIFFDDTYTKTCKGRC